MKERIIAKRYGRALFELAIESGDPVRLKAEILSLLGAFREIPLIERALSDEIIDLPKRIMASERIALSIGLGKAATNFLKFMLFRGRVTAIRLAGEDFLRRMEQYTKLLVARASVAEPSTVAEAKVKIEAAITAALQFKSRCDVSVDPTLIGGFEVWLGDIRYDASIRGKLERMKEEVQKNHPPAIGREA